MPPYCRVRHPNEFIVKVVRVRDRFTVSDSCGNILFAGVVSKQLAKRFRGRLQAWFYAHHNDNGKLVLGWRAPAQPW